ncbi:HEAT repeat domain-containing protein, partial [Chloroflexota bacterium]
VCMMSNSPDGFEQLLEDLGDESVTIPFSKLYELSDLYGPRLDTFQSGLDSYPTAQRQRLVLALAELAEASFDVNFDAIFRHCLYDSDPLVRAASIEGLWESDDVSLIGRFLRVMRSDPSPHVRAAAAKGLGRYVLAGELEELGAPVSSRIITELLTVMHSSGESIEVRRRAIESVAYACTEEVLEAIDLAYYHDDEDMRLSSMLGMGRSCDRRWEPIVLLELESSSAAMRYEAALASGELALVSSVPLLSHLLDDADRQVCEAAIWALGQIGGHGAREVLLDAMDQGDDDTQAAISDALAELALSEGAVDFALYDLDADLDDEIETGGFISLWEADDTEEGNPFGEPSPDSP